MLSALDALQIGLDHLDHQFFERGVQIAVFVERVDQCADEAPVAHETLFDWYVSAVAEQFPFSESNAHKPACLKARSPTGVSLGNE